MASKVRVAVLVWADVLAGYAMWVMMTYLTNVWKLDITHAAAIVNVFTGVAFIMPIAMAFLVDAFLGHYRMLLLSSLAYSFGMSLLAMSTPPVLSRYAGNCNAYKPECIGDTQKALFYTALALITVGISGHITSLKSFEKQQEEPDQTPNGQLTSARVQEDQTPNGQLPEDLGKLLGFFVVILVVPVGGIALQYIKPWSVRFGIPAICTVIATILFISGSCSYKYGHDIPEGSPLTIIFRVFIASASKMFYSRDANDQLNGNPLSLTPSLRCLDKAAIIVPSTTQQQHEQNR